MVDPNALFDRMTVNAARLALEKVQATGTDTANGTVPEEVRRQAWHTLSLALDREPAWPQVRELLLALAPKMEIAGFRHEWIPFLDAGIERSQERNDPPVTAELLLQRGYLFLRMREFARAETDLRAAATTFQALGKPRRQSVCLQRLAMNSYFQEKLEGVEPLLAEAAALLAEGDPEWAYCHFVRGILAENRLAWEKASGHFQRGLDVATIHQDLRLMGLCRFNLGRMRLNSYMYHLDELSPEEGAARCQEALGHLQQAKPLLQQAGDVHNLASLLYVMGLTYSYLQESEAALAQYAQAEPVAAQLSDADSLGWIHHNRALEYRKLNRLKDAELSLEQAIGIWQRLGRAYARRLSQEVLGLVYLQEGRLAETVQLYTELRAELEGVPAEQRDGEWERQAEAVAQGLQTAQKPPPGQGSSETEV